MDTVVAIVVAANGLLGIFCLLMAWQLWRLKRYFTRAANALTAAEQSVHRVLRPTPRAILIGGLNIQTLRQQYYQLSVRAQQAQQLLQLVGLGQMLLFQRAGLGRRSRYQR